MRVVSSDSVRLSGGRIAGIRWASMVLPVLGDRGWWPVRSILPARRRPLPGSPGRSTPDDSIRGRLVAWRGVRTQRTGSGEVDQGAVRHHLGDPLDRFVLTF